MDRKELMQQIKEVLKNDYCQEAGDPFLETAIFDDKVCSFMNDVLSEEQLQKILNLLVDNAGHVSRDDIFSVVKSMGLLKCKPTVVYDGHSLCKTPSLCIAYNRYLHDFRGYYFQISGTRDGVGSHAMSCFRMDKLLRITRDNVEDKCKCGLLTNFIVAMSALTTLLDYFEYTQKLLNDSREVMEKFINETVKAKYRYAAGMTEQPLAILLDSTRIQKSSELPTVEPDNLNIALYDKHDNSYYGLLECCENLIKFTKFNGKQYSTTVLTIPETLNEDLQPYKDVFMCAFVEYVLKFSGVRANYMTMHPSGAQQSDFAQFRINVPHVADDFGTIVDLVQEHYKNNSLDELDVF